MSHFEAPIWSMQVAETFPINFGHTLPNSTNHLGALATLDLLGLDPHLSSPPHFDGILVDISNLTSSFAIST